MQPRSSGRVRAVGSVLALTAPILAACGADATTGSGAAAADSTGTDGDRSDAEPTVESVPPATSESCDVDRRTLEVATEAYAAQYGDEPSSQIDLVPDFLRGPIDTYDLVGGEIVRVADVPCRAGHPGDDTAGSDDWNADGTMPDEPLTVDDYLALFDASGFDFGSLDCATEAARLTVAFDAVDGATEFDGAALIAGLDPPIVRWVWDDATSEIVPVEGSGCSLPEIGPSDVERCTIDFNTLRVASEAYTARFGTPPPDHHALADADFILEVPEGFTVTDAVVTVDAGTTCDGLVDADPTAAPGSSGSTEPVSGTTDG